MYKHYLTVRHFEVRKSKNNYISYTYVMTDLQKINNLYMNGFTSPFLLLHGFSTLILKLLIKHENIMNICLLPFYIVFLTILYCQKYIWPDDHWDFKRRHRSIHLDGSYRGWKSNCNSFFNLMGLTFWSKLSLMSSAILSTSLIESFRSFGGLSNIKSI